MGLLSNLRVLCGSDIGDNVRELRRRMAQLESDLDAQAELHESRFRMLNKRARDAARTARTNEREEVQVNGTDPGESPLVARIRARRALRAGGLPG